MTRTHPRTLSSRVRRGVIWNAITTLALRVVNILITATIAHILSPKDFGVFAVALTAFTIVSAIGEFGVASCLIRADLDLDALAPTMATVSLASSAVMAGVMAIFAGPIATALGSRYAAGPVRVMALAVILTGILAVPSAQLVRDFKQDKIFLANIISFVPSTAVLLILAKFGSGSMAFAWSRVVGQFAVGAVMIASTGRHYWPGASRNAFSVLWRFGIPLAGANFVNFILLNVDYALVGRFMGPVALGTYVLAFNVASWPSNLLGSIINNVAMPAFSRVKHDAELLRKSISDSLRMVALVVMPMCAIIVALARPLVLTLYGAKWAAASGVLSALAIYSAVSVVCLLFANMLGGTGKTRMLLVIQIIWLAALAPAMLIGVHYRGIVGAAFAHVVIIGPIVLPCYLFAMRRSIGTHIRPLAAAIVPAVVASAVAAAAAYGAASVFTEPPAQLVAGLLAGGVIYVAGALPQFIGLLGPGQLRKLRRRRAFRVYIALARLVGIPVLSGRHAARGRSRYQRVQPQRGASRPQPEVARSAPNS
jgi:lipopolysaccharide exporter